MGAQRWFPGAERLACSSPGGRTEGGEPKAVWHTTESDTGNTAFNAVARYLYQKGSEPTLLWDPTTGRVGQFMPADLSGRALANAGTVRTNRTGSPTIQIEVMGRAADRPLRDGPCVGLPEILDWLDSWGIPRDWPGGYPLSSPESYGANGNRSLSRWKRAGGHFAHSQVPGNTHSDPGLIDPAKWAKEEGGNVNGDVYAYDYLGKPNEVDPEKWGTQVIGRKYTELDLSGFDPDPAIAAVEFTLAYMNMRPTFEEGKSAGAVRIRVKRADGDAAGPDELLLHRDALDEGGKSLRLFLFFEANKDTGTKVQVKCIGGVSSCEVSTRYTKKARVHKHPGNA